MGKFSKIDDSLADCRSTLDKCKEILQAKAGAQIMLIKKGLGQKTIDMSCWPNRSSARECDVEGQNGKKLSNIIDSMYVATYSYSCKNEKIRIRMSSEIYRVG
jgi:hypothetical protein